MHQSPSPATASITTPHPLTIPHFSSPTITTLHRTSPYHHLPPPPSPSITDYQHYITNHSFYRPYNHWLLTPMSSLSIPISPKKGRVEIHTTFSAIFEHVIYVAKMFCGKRGKLIDVNGVTFELRCRVRNFLSTTTTDPQRIIKKTTNLPRETCTMSKCTHYKATMIDRIRVYDEGSIIKVQKFINESDTWSADLKTSM